VANDANSVDPGWLPGQRSGLPQSPPRLAGGACAVVQLAAVLVQLPAAAAPQPGRRHRGRPVSGGRDFRLMLNLGQALTSPLPRVGPRLAFPLAPDSALVNCQAALPLAPCYFLAPALPALLQHAAHLGAEIGGGPCALAFGALPHALRPQFPVRRHACALTLAAIGKVPVAMPGAGRELLEAQPLITVRAVLLARGDPSCSRVWRAATLAAIASFIPPRGEPFGMIQSFATTRGPGPAGPCVRSPRTPSARPSRLMMRAPTMT